MCFSSNKYLKTDLNEAKLSRFIGRVWDLSET